MHRPLLIGRGPWGQKLLKALPKEANPTISGRISAMDCIADAKRHGNDCVIIASALESHLPLSVAAMQRGLPVFCEKPCVASSLEMDALELAWLAADKPHFVCDFTHLWSSGFELADTRATDAARSGALPKFYANIGGPGPKRPDCHPVWDWGSHVIAMAVHLGVDLKGLTMDKGYGEQWILENDHAEIYVGVDYPEKRFDVELGDLFDYHGASGQWLFEGVPSVSDPHGTTILNEVDPPLQRALKMFLAGERDPRTGLALPCRVTDVLERLCPSASPYRER